MRKFSRFLFGAMLGGFLGGAAVLLLAPESGADTREALRYRFEKFSDQIKTAVEERRAQLRQEIEKYKTEG